MWEETTAKIAGGIAVLIGAAYTIIRVIKGNRSTDAASTIQDKLLEQLHKAAEVMQAENDTLRARIDEQDKALDALRERIERLQDEMFRLRGRAARAEAVLRQHNIPVPRSSTES